MMHWNETLVVALGAMLGVLLIVIAVVWQKPRPSLNFTNASRSKGPKPAL